MAGSLLHQRGQRRRGARAEWRAAAHVRGRSRHVSRAAMWGGVAGGVAERLLPAAGQRALDQQLEPVGRKLPPAAGRRRRAPGAVSARVRRPAMTSIAAGSVASSAQRHDGVDQRRQPVEAGADRGRRARGAGASSRARASTVAAMSRSTSANSAAGPSPSVPRDHDVAQGAVGDGRQDRGDAGPRRAACRRSSRRAAGAVPRWCPSRSGRVRNEGRDRGGGGRGGTA